MKHKVPKKLKFKSILIKLGGGEMTVQEAIDAINKLDNDCSND